jgi:uncharacterized protein (TIGR03032 family)
VTLTSPASEATSPLQEKFVLTTSRQFTEWLARANATIVFTTYQAGKVFFPGINAEGRLAVFERSFPRCMGLGVSANNRTVILATEHQLLRFDNVVPAGALSGQHDAVFAPHMAWITGDVDAHDVGSGPTASRSS